MAVSESQRELDALAAAGLALASAGNLADALQLVVDAALKATHAEVALARVADDGRGQAGVAAVSTQSAALGAELAGSRLGLDELPEHEETQLDRLPAGTRSAARRAGASAVVVLPAQIDGRVRGSLELMRSGERFSRRERHLARLAAGQVTLAIRASAAAAHPSTFSGPRRCSPSRATLWQRVRTRLRRPVSSRALPPRRRERSLRSSGGAARRVSSSSSPRPVRTARPPAERRPSVRWPVGAR